MQHGRLARPALVLKWVDGELECALPLAASSSQGRGKILVEEMSVGGGRWRVADVEGRAGDASTLGNGLHQRRRVALRHTLNENHELGRFGLSLTRLRYGGRQERSLADRPAECVQHVHGRFEVDA